MPDITWSISTLERHTSDEIVYTAHFTVSATDGEYSASTYGSVGFEAPADGDTVIPYTDLTPETVIGWVQDKLDIDSIHASLDAQLIEQRQPTKASGLPWAG
jgi:hypothetical protein